MISWNLKPFGLAPFALYLAAACQNPRHPLQRNSTSSPKIDAPAPGQAPIDLVENKKEMVFNLAEFLAHQRESKEQGIEKVLSEGKDYFDLGDKSKFALQSNVEMQSIVNKGFDDESMGISGRFWADGFVFGKLLGGKGQGSLLQIGIDAMASSMALYGHIRYLGQDRLAGKLNSKIDKMLTRTLTSEAMLYGSDLLGVKASGNIGGEIGISADLDRRVDDALMLGFIPRSGLSAGLGGKVELLKFARAEIAGTVGLMATDLATQGAMGAIKSAGVVLGDVGMAGGSLRALDGKVLIGASVGSGNGLLPAGVEPRFWQAIDSHLKTYLSLMMPDISKWTWVHVLWDPTPFSLSTFPLYSQPYLNLIEHPKTASACAAQYEALSGKIDVFVANTEKLVRDIDDQYQNSGEKDKALVQRMRILATSKTNYRTIQAKLEDRCDGMAAP